MPGESAIAILPVGPGSAARESAPANAAPLTPGSPARSPFSRQAKPNDDRLKAARSKLEAVGKGMKDGTITGRQAVSADASATTAAKADDAGAVTLDGKPATPAPAKKEATAEEKTAAAEKSKNLSAAKRALALDGWKPESINKLDEEELLAIGNHRAKNQADVNREFAKLRNAATSPTGARNADGTFATPDGTPPAKEGEAAPPKKDAEAPAAPTGDKELDALIDAAKDDIGEPAVKLFKALNKHYAGKVASAGEVGNAVTTEMLYSQGREIAEKEYPDQFTEKADPKAFDEVAENFKALVASGRYGRGQISKAWRDAAFMAFGAPKTVRNAQRDMLARQQAADVGKIEAPRGDTGATTEAPPITSTRDALKLAGKMMAENPGANPDKLRQALMARVRGNRG